MAILLVRSAHTLLITGGGASCPVRVTSPARSDYVFEMDCGQPKTTFKGKLNLLGNELTLTPSDVPATIVMRRE